jgi:hypothetical protein
MVKDKQPVYKNGSSQYSKIGKQLNKIIKEDEAKENKSSTHTTSKFKREKNNEKKE